MEYLYKILRQYLGLQENSLSGNLQPVYSLTKLSRLKLGYNEFTGNIVGIESLVNLEFLGLVNNLLSGNLQPLICLTKLRYLYLDNNRFTGSIKYLTKLETWSASGNDFDGS